MLYLATNPIVESDIVNGKETASPVIPPDSLNYNLQKKVKTLQATKKTVIRAW